jgi:hypothetical protein
MTNKFRTPAARARAEMGDSYYGDRVSTQSNIPKKLQQKIHHPNLEKNKKHFGDLVKWTGDESNIYSDYFRFRRELHMAIEYAVYSMETRGVENDKDIYSVFCGDNDFKWYNNEYTIYANGRDARKDEKESTLNDQFATIAKTVYDKKRSPDTVLKEGETEWEGSFVGKELAVDISIKWEKNVWKSTSHLPEQGKFKGRIVAKAEVYFIVFTSMMQAIKTASDLPGEGKTKLQEHFLGYNTQNFMDRYSDYLFDKITEDK